MEIGELDFLVDAVERASLGNMFFHGRRARIERSVSMALLTQLCRQEPLIESNVAWVAFSPGMDRDLDWQLALIENGAGGSLSDTDVEQVVPPMSCPDLAKKAMSTYTGEPGYLVNASSLDQAWTGWDPISSHGVQQLYLQPIGEEIEKEYDLLAGWIVVALINLDGAAISRIRDSVGSVFRELRDYFRILASARASDTRLLSLTDFDAMPGGFNIVRLERPKELVDSLKPVTPVGDPIALSPTATGPWFAGDWYLAHRASIVEEFKQTLDRRGTAIKGEPEAAENLNGFIGAYQIPREFTAIVEVAEGHAVLKLINSGEALIRLMLRVQECGRVSARSLWS